MSANATVAALPISARPRRVTKSRRQQGGTIGGISKILLFGAVDALSKECIAIGDAGLDPASPLI
jgi:hypothetical protein